MMFDFIDDVVDLSIISDLLALGAKPKASTTKAQGFNDERGERQPTCSPRLTASSFASWLPLHCAKHSNGNAARAEAPDLGGRSGAAPGG